MMPVAGCRRKAVILQRLGLQQLQVAVQRRGTPGSAAGSAPAARPGSQRVLLQRPQGVAVPLKGRCSSRAPVAAKGRVPRLHNATQHTCSVVSSARAPSRALHQRRHCALVAQVKRPLEHERCF